MNREILFRGKPDIDQEWLDEMEFTLDEYMENLVSANYKDGFVYGQVVYGGKQPYIVGEVVESTDEWITLEYWIPVKPETVGQYTGLKDKNGVKIYQDDIVRHGSIKKGNTYVVAWDGRSGSFYYKPSDSKGFGGYRMFINHRGLTPYEVLGTTHDNPELLEVQNE